MDHQNICTVYEVDESEEQTFIAMAYIKGQSLKDKIAEGSLAVKKAVDIAAQVAEGLKIAHEKGIIHRDIKPANIMLTEKGQAKIMDFGLARLERGADLTKTATIMGTVAYMSPEQASGKRADHRTDIWSLGCVLFEMLSGQSPFKRDYDQAVLYSILHEEAQSITSIRRDVSPGIEMIIGRCLQKDPRNRYQDDGSLIEELKSTDFLDSTGSPPISPKKEPIPSIAVLPFVDLSPKKDQEYFCHGVAEELINALTQVEGLKVAARTSSFSFKGKDEDIRRIGKQLNVRSILEGSVQKSGNRLRVTAQLINVADGYHVWSERFDRNIKYVFSVQDEIAMGVVKRLEVELLEEEKEKVVKRHTRDSEAYQLYLKGRYHWNRRSPRDMILAVDFFQRAIDKDPHFALPYAGIADVFNMLAEFGFIPPQQAYLKSRSLLQKAMEIDDSLSEVYSSLALITYCYEWDLPAAERHALRSIELNPQNMWAHAVYGEILGALGRTEEALEEAKKTMGLDPLSSMSYALYSFILALQGRTEESREQQLRALAMEPDQPMFYLWLGMNYLAKPAVPEKAIEYFQKALDMGVALADGYLGMGLALSGRKEEALKCLEKLNRIEKERFIPLPLKLLIYLKPGLRHFRSYKKKYCPSYMKTLIYWGLNMREEALDQLEKSCQARDYLLPAFFKLAEIYDMPWDITTSTRFQKLRAKIKTA